MRHLFFPRAPLLAALAVSSGCGSKGGSFTGTPGESGGADASAGDDSPGSFSPPTSGPGALFGPGSDASSTGTAGGSAQATSIDRCSSGIPSGLSAASVRALMAGGSAGSMRYLYPYADTVFPRGLIAPTLMWDGASADYVYVHIKSKLFEYQGCLAPTAAGQILLPQDVWNEMGDHAFGASDPFSVSLTVIASAKVAGPITESIVIAPATLKGSVYYNSYLSALAASMGGAGGAVLRLVPGQKVSLFLGKSGCTGCHAVSANGKRMVAEPFFGSVNMGSGATYALSQQGTANPPPLVANAPNATFVGVYPDGSLYLGNAHPDNGLGGPRSGGPGAVGPTDSALYETDTGNAVNNTGIPTGAMMGMFSPDGTRLTFNDLAIAGGPSGTGPQGLATMTFDASSRTAKDYKKIFQAANASSYPGWPFFLPDNNAIVFAIGDQQDFSGAGVGLIGGGALGTTGAPKSDLYMLDLISGKSTILAKAMGFASAQDVSSDKTYLPFGASEEVHHNYYPTVSPIAAGGYFWVFFDSFRHYGNLGLQRQLWGTAVDVSSSGTYASDPSHPPFYLTGQEEGTGNHRAFTALDPCKASGSSCTTGVDCCNGFCTNGVCGAPMTPRCSQIDEACSAGHSCCDGTAQCINGFCALSIR